MRSGRAARHTHDYKRHGVVDLYAALEIATGNVTHRVTESHTGADFLAFMKTVVRRYSKQQLHVVLDNSSTHGTPDVKAWLAANPQVHFHYTPTSASWLNQVEGFFGILGKQSLGATDFPSKRALRDHLNLRGEENDFGDIVETGQTDPGTGLTSRSHSGILATPTGIEPVLPT